MVNLAKSDDLTGFGGEESTYLSSNSISNQDPNSE
ncbi:uncharacterized protein G2W53_014659 [Senna tora]|uniref:Uncharacterized protein n=1 Tax=Senna tora TaxID=362788 RepID=A0A834WTV7_9FABA|nr:uncharacterized protein G2W53_014659 [Senna tora]